MDAEAMAADYAALQFHIQQAVAAALAAPVAAHVAVKLPYFWVKDPKMWFAQAEAQFRRARITVEGTKYDHEGWSNFRRTSLCQSGL
jgi:hypothetical protein